MMSERCLGDEGQEMCSMCQCSYHKVTDLNTVIFMSCDQVHRIYRSTGASFAKAQAEFAHGVMSNRTVQETAGNAAAAAARNAVNQSMSGGR